MSEFKPICKEISELCVSPAPWYYDEDSNDIICHLANGIRYQVAVPYIHCNEQTDGNARMMVASPLMYNALHQVTESLKFLIEGLERDGKVVPHYMKNQITEAQYALLVASEGDEFKVAKDDEQ